MHFLLESETIDTVERSDTFCALLEVKERRHILFIKGHVQIHEIGDLLESVAVFWLDKMCSNQYLFLAAG